jgi:hypothetical protein
MDVAAADNSSLSVESILAAKQQKLAGEVGVGVLKKGLDLQKDLMSELFRDMGIGQSVDIKV